MSGPCRAVRVRVRVVEFSYKLFHTRGPETAKLLSPRVVRVRGTASVLCDVVVVARVCAGCFW